LFRMNLAQTAPRDHEDFLDVFLTENCALPLRTRKAFPDQPMEYELTHHDFGKAEVVDITFSNHWGVAPTRFPQSSDEKVIAIALPKGPMKISQGDRALETHDHSIVPFWGYAPYALWIEDSIRYQAIVLPVSMLGLPDLLVRNLTGTDLGDSPLAGIVSHHLEGLVALGDVDQIAGAMLEQTTVDLLRALLVTAAGDEFMAREPLEATLVTRARIFIESHLWDPELSVTRVATHLGISRTRAYEIIADLGIDFTEWLRNRRLERAAKELGTHAAGALPISELARRVGFQEHSTFTRAFTARYGMSPSAWRAQSRDSNGSLPTR
jgi:AraC-like DNA-binding protein